MTRPLDFNIANKGRDRFRFCLSDCLCYYLVHTKEDISCWFYLILSPKSRLASSDVSLRGRCLKMALCHQKARFLGGLERLGHFLNLNATVFKAKKRRRNFTPISLRPSSVSVTAGLSQ